MGLADPIHREARVWFKHTQIQKLSAPALLLLAVTISTERIHSSVKYIKY